MDVVISGVGCITPLGSNPDITYQNICNKKSVFNSITLDGFKPKTILVGQLSADQLDNVKNNSSRCGIGDDHSLNTHFAIYAAEQALQDARIQPGTRMGLVIANNDGNSDLLEAAVETNAPPINYCGTSTLQSIRKVTNSSGFNSIIYNTCASFNTALETATNLIKQNVHDTVLVGGTDLLANKVLYGFDTLRVLSNNPCKPFCRDRGNITISEGSAFLVLQKSCEAKKRYCSVIATARNCDAGHPTSPNEESILQCHQMILQKANLIASDIDVLFAHGTGTGANDRIEASIYNALDYSAVVCAPKTLLGHNMAACGAVAAAMIAKTFEHKHIPLTSKYEDEHEFALNFVNQKNASLVDVKYIQSNSFGFGGNNAIALFGA